MANVRFSIARFRRPWELNIDAIVLSVGNILGGLGEAVRSEFPSSDWDSVEFDAITPERPASLSLHSETYSGTLRLAILATPHVGNRSGQPTVDAARLATRAALRAAMSGGVSALGLPMMGTGRDNLRDRDVALAVVPELLSVLDESQGSALRHVVFVCMEPATEQAIREVWELTTTARLHTVVVSPAREATPLAGGMSGELVDPTRGVPRSEDQLGVGVYASMLATVIADRRTPLPLSIGVFGEWGSGKSFFMGMLRHEVARLAKSENTDYCRTIEQISFNAWHYADSNLWASLGDEIFRQLAGPEPSAGERRSELRAEMAKRLVQHKDLTSATEKAHAEVVDLRKDVDEATMRREEEATALLAALPPVLKKQFDRLWNRLGVRDAADKGLLLAEQMRDTITEAEILRRAPMDRYGKAVIGISAVALAAVACVAVAVPEVLAIAGPVCTTAVGVGVALIHRVRLGLRSLREIAEDLHAGRRHVAQTSLPPEAVEKVEALRRAETDQQIAEARLTEVVAKVGELGQQLADLDPGKRLYTFLAERADGDSYTRNLGLISMIRKDFEQLVSLMADSQENKDKTVKKDGTVREPIDRIVLYIDDLDRCSPRQVVDVLQAVHLLLAMKLFVVVVGVDPRWLLRSLSSHYDELLDTDGTQSADSWRVTPEDYLEKILNIPLVLPGLSTGNLLGLLTSLLGENSSEAAAATAVAMASEAQLSGGPPEPARSATIEVGSEVASKVSARPLTHPELSLLATLDSLIDTPREAKRVMNIYRMVRATKDLSDAARFLGGYGGPGEYQAVVILLGLLTAHARLLAGVLDASPDPHSGSRGGLVHRPQDTPWDEFVADIEPQAHDSRWTNGIVGVIDSADTRRWSRLHTGLVRMSAEIELDDLSVLQEWVPTIRRFSYLIAESGRATG